MVMVVINQLHTTDNSILGYLIIEMEIILNRAIITMEEEEEEEEEEG